MTIDKISKRTILNKYNFEEKMEEIFETFPKHLPDGCEMTVDIRILIEFEGGK
jgi:hypothetical protein